MRKMREDRKRTLDPLVEQESSIPESKRRVADALRKMPLRSRSLRHNTLNLNKIQLIGRLTRDPELRTTPGGTAVAKFGLATNHSYKDKNGEKKDTTQFHNCVAFGKTAEVIAQYVKKGHEFYVCGRIEYSSWDKKDGTKGYATEIMVEEFQFGAKPKGERSAAEAIVEEAETQGVKVEDIPF